MGKCFIVSEDERPCVRIPKRGHSLTYILISNFGRGLIANGDDIEKGRLFYTLYGRINTYNSPIC